MDKAQALNKFWSSFGIPAYDVNTVPDDAVMPYITYETTTDSIDNALSLSGSIWYRQMSWVDVSKKADEIAEYLYKQNPVTMKVDGGRLYITKGTPFAQRMNDPSDDMIRRMYINIMAEFFTAY